MRNSNHSSYKNSRRLRLEQLEDKNLLAIMVSNLNASGPGSLRAAIEEANNNNDDSVTDRIEFEPFVSAGTINLSNGTGGALPIITAPVQITTATHPQYDPTDPFITINGAALSAGDGFQIDNSSNQNSFGRYEIQGFEIINFPGNGILVNDLPDNQVFGAFNNVLDSNGRLSTSSGINVTDTGFGPEFDAITIHDNTLTNNDFGIRINNFKGGLDIDDNFVGTDGTSTNDGNSSTGILINGYTARPGQQSISGNIVSGNGGDGIKISNSNASSNKLTLSSNRIGVSEDQTLVIGNGLDGIRVDNASAVDDLLANTVSGNGRHGIFIQRTDDVRVRFNSIGTDSTTKTRNLGNTVAGIEVGFSADDSTLFSNTVSFNGADGIRLIASAGNRHEISENDFRGNEESPIDLLGVNGLDTNDTNDGDSGPNDLMNHQIIQSSLIRLDNTTWTVPFTFDVDIAGEYEFQFYKVNANLGQYDYIKSRTISGVTTGPNDFESSITFSNGTQLSAGDSIAALAIRNSNTNAGNTSEMSDAVEIRLAGDFDKDGDVDQFDLDTWMGSYGTSVTPFTAGDADGDGDVDGADFLEWQRNFSGPMPLVTGDYNKDGKVDEADYNVWESNFGTAYAAADGNGNGIVDIGDLAVYQEHFMITTLDEMPGDFDESGVVDSGDFFLWSAGDLRADADEDGDVDGDDFDVFEANFGLTHASLAPVILGNTAGMPLEIPMAAPQVLNFSIGSTISSDPTFDFDAVVGSGEQLRTVPVSAANTVSIRFSEEVFVTENTLEVTNLDGSSPTSIVGFTYQIDTQTATWEFGSSFADGRYLITLADEIYDLDHELLDGEFANPWTLADTTSDTFASGNDEAGGDFRFRATILANDIDRDNIDGATDYTDWLSVEPGMILVSTTADELDTDYSIGDVSLREAVQLANAATEPTTILLPTGRYSLTRGGTEAGDASYNDLDITSIVSIVGDGAGLSVIDVELPDGMNDNNPHAFQLSTVGARLDLQKLTIANGYSWTPGQAVSALAGTYLTIADSAIVNHGSTGEGTAVHAVSADVTIVRSVFENNDNMYPDGAAVYVRGDQANPATLTITDSIFAHSYQAGMYIWGPTTKNVEIFGEVTKINGGNNLYDDASGGFFDTTPGAGDHLGSVNYVVTTVADTFDHTDNSESLSLREAVDLANNAAGTQEIWLPAWDFELTRDRGANVTDTDVAYGDLDIKDSLIVRGVAGETSVVWTAGITDAVFDLLGDFSGDGMTTVDDGDVDGDDYFTWSSQNGSTGGTYSADADDDGDVDGDDLDIWSEHYGNTFDLFNVAV